MSPRLHSAPASAATSPHSPPGQVPTGTGPILVATAGAENSDGALRAGYLLAGRTNADVELISAVDARDAAAAAGPLARLAPLVGRASQPERDAAIAAQLARAGLASPGWPVEIVGGDPARVIAGRSRAAGARVVVLGRSRRAALGWHDADLALRLLRLGDVPVLAVTPDLARLPRRVVLATDFTPYSDYAGRVALSLAAPDALVHVVHVMPDPPLGADEARWRQQYRTSAQPELARMRDELSAGNGRTVETVVLGGDPAPTIAEYASAIAADLVACAAHGRGFLDRLFLGSVAAGLLHRVPCSVLCVPGSAAARAAQRRWASAGLQTMAVPPDEWPATLTELSRRAAGRPCVVEVDRPALGAQQLADGVAFEGADYDPHGRRVTLRLGASTAGGRHLAHVIAGATSLELVTDAAGTTRVLRVGDDEGQTLVTFTA